MTDKLALRKAAIAATGGKWVFSRSGVNSNVQAPIELQKGGRALVVLCKLNNAGWSGQIQTENNAKFIAAANPATVLALLDELEVAEQRNAELVHNHRVHAARLIDERGQLKQRIAELEALAKSVKFDPIPMEELGNKSDGKKHPYMFGAGYNSAVVHCESVLSLAFAAAGIGKGA
ncbi:TPA: ead/Ea22-like family protein [Citrobacter koseri]|nr:ead/Ea22-like family protein [Citrobacter koseri]